MSTPKESFLEFIKQYGGGVNPFSEWLAKTSRINEHNEIRIINSRKTSKIMLVTKKLKFNAGQGFYGCKEHDNYLVRVGVADYRFDSLTAARAYFEQLEVEKSIWRVISTENVMMPMDLLESYTYVSDKRPNNKAIQESSQQTLERLLNDGTIEKLGGYYKLKK